MEYLVTGGTGFVGANVVRHLLAQGHSVRCIVRKSNLCLDGLPVQLHQIGLEDEEALVRAADGCDGIFHVAGTFDPGPGGEELMKRLHVDATERLCVAAKRAGVRRVLVCSSSITVGFGPMEAPGDEETPLDVEGTYGRTGALRVYHDSKLESEKIAFAYGGVVVNPDYVIGAWDIKPTSGQLLLTMARHPVPFFPRGGKCFIDADDCALGHLLAMEKGQAGRRYLLGNHNVPYQKFMALCAAMAGRRAPWLPVPGLALRGAGRVGSLLQRMDAHRFAGLERHVLLAMQQQRYRSGRRSWDELGVPKTDLAQAIQKAWDWFVEHRYLATRG